MSKENLVEEHRKMVGLSGMISDFQLANLKVWPHIVMNEKLDSVQVNYDFTSVNKKPNPNEMNQLCAGTVEFDFIFKDGKVPYTKLEVKKRLATLESWVRHLFWVDTQVIMKLEGKKWPI